LSALIFQGKIVGGFALGLAALIMGTVVTCLVVALTSTLSPADAEPDDPAVAVMSVLASSVAAALVAKGASNQAVIVNVLVAISVSTLFTGILLFGLGALRLGQWLRFVPYPVIGGFFASSGLVLIIGGVEVVTQTSLKLAPSSWAVLYSSLYAPQIGVGFLFVLSISFLRRWVPSYLAMPIAFVGFLVVLDRVLFGLIRDRSVRSAWFLPDLGKLTLWWPIAAVSRDEIDWGVLARNVAEIGVVCGVTAVSLLLEISSLEVARKNPGSKSGWRLMPNMRRSGRTSRLSVSRRRMQRTGKANLTRSNCYRRTLAKVIESWTAYAERAGQVAGAPDLERGTWRSIRP
jgi:sulfate permease, SulP family